MALNNYYNIEIDTPLGKQTAKLALKTDDNALSGSVEAEMVGIEEFSGGTVNGDDVAWNMELDSPMGKLILEFKGKIKGDEITGELKAGDFGSSPFTGKRVR